MVCHRRGLQIRPQERVERQELVLVGVLALQQQLPGAARREGDAGGGQSAAEASGRSAGLRQQRAVLLRRHELAAHPHLRDLLPAARGAHLHDLEQVGHDPLRTARARLCGGQLLGPGSAAAAAADGAVQAGVALPDRDEELPLREKSAPLGLVWTQSKAWGQESRAEETVLALGKVAASGRKGGSVGDMHITVLGSCFNVR